MKLAEEILARLKDRKNLLAFSGGADSTALFFLLLEQNIPFDIAIINYHTRPQSDEECAYAQQLSDAYGKTCHIHHAEPIETNFEHRARTVRYDFFAALCREHGYENLLTAHQLDDRLEWLLMQLAKGAGLIEMMGMQPIEATGHYTLVRPLLGFSKAELQAYLEAAGRTWFEDESNRDERHLRNRFRLHHAAPMLRDFKKGIAKSLAYLDEDRASLCGTTDVHHAESFYIFATRASRRATLNTVDRILKTLGYLMRQGERERLKQEHCLVVGRRYVVAIGTNYTCIAPYEETVMGKEFKEKCRRLGIAPKLRGYLSKHPEAFALAASLIGEAVDLHREG